MSLACIVMDVGLRLQKHINWYFIMLLFSPNIDGMRFLQKISNGCADCFTDSMICDTLWGSRSLAIENCTFLEFGVFTSPEWLDQSPSRHERFCAWSWSVHELRRVAWLANKSTLRFDLQVARQKMQTSTMLLAKQCYWAEKMMRDLVMMSQKHM